MGLLNEFFLATDDEEAKRALPDGPAAADFVEVVPSGGMTNREIELIEQAVTGRPGTGAAVTVLSEDVAPEGPWVIRFPDTVTEALLEVGDREVEAVAARWAAFDALKDADAGSLSGLLLDLIDLAGLGLSSGRSPYLWICL